MEFLVNVPNLEFKKQSEGGGGGLVGVLIVLGDKKSPSSPWVKSVTAPRPMQYALIKVSL